MLQIGILLLLFGAGSFGLNAMDMEFKLLMWVDNWGRETGNMIRYGAIGLGVLMITINLVTSKRDSAE